MHVRTRLVVSYVIEISCGTKMGLDFGAVELALAVNDFCCQVDALEEELREN
jgi:hypothetical protein